MPQSIRCSFLTAHLLLAKAKNIPTWSMRISNVHLSGGCIVEEMSENQFKSSRPTANVLAAMPHAQPDYHHSTLVGIPDHDGDLPLHIAVAKEDAKQVAIIIDLMLYHGLNIDVFNHLRQTPLHIAVITGNVGITRMLLDAGSSPGAPDRHGNTAVHLAVKCTNTDCMLELLHGSDCQSVTDDQNYDGFAPIHLAVFRQDLALIKTLVSKNANIDALDGTSGRSPLFHATENGFEAVIDLLLRLDADVNQPNFNGTTPIMVATEKGNSSVVGLLLSQGARDDS